MDMKKRRDMQIAYIADGAVMEEQKRCRKVLQRLNFADRSDFDGIAKIVKELLGKSEGACINPPFYCDYGSHIEVGKNFFANYNCTIIDVAKVKIGDNCQMAPNVAIYTAGHPIYPDTRNSAFEYGKEVTIGDNVWLGGNTVVCPGVHIGNNVVIGAGSVVTKDIPDWSIAAGNPCRVIRKITEKDKRKLFHDEEIDDEAWDMISAQEMQMKIDITLKITPKMVTDAQGNEKKALVGHLGTHFDVMNKEFPLTYTKRKGILFNVSEVKNRDIDITDVDLDKIDPDMFVAFYTGFIEEEGYGTRKYFTEHPQLSNELIEALLKKKISIIGVDFAGVRRGKEHTPMDQHCADHGVFIVENLCNLKCLLENGDTFIANTYPMNYADMTGLPCRVVAEPFNLSKNDVQ